MKHSRSGITTRRSFYNQCINFFWTILCFAPVLSFWIKNGIDQRLYIFMAISCLAALTPEQVLNRLQISKRQKFYHKIGIKIVQKLVQDGQWSGDLRRYLSTIAMYERFHWCCFLFFTATTIYGYPSSNWAWKLGILIANLLYNVYPILLQQYNKMRIKRILARQPKEHLEDI